MGRDLRARGGPLIVRSVAAAIGRMLPVLFGISVLVFLIVMLGVPQHAHPSVDSKRSQADNDADRDSREELGHC